MKRRMKKRTSGGKAFSLTTLFLLLFATSALWGGNENPPQAVIAGTVFRDPGFALARAEVILTVKTPPSSARKQIKPRKILTDARGEFAFYVPPEKAAYVVSVKAAGLESQERTVELNGGPDRTDAYFTLKPAATALPKE